MNHHDQELLDKQLRAIYRPPRAPGLIAAAALTIFVAGLIAGNLMTRASAPQIAAQIAANGPSLAFLDTGAPITRN